MIVISLFAYLVPQSGIASALPDYECVETNNDPGAMITKCSIEEPGVSPEITIELPNGEIIAPGGPDSPVHVTTLRNDDGAASDQFGHDVAFDDDTILVGAQGDKTDSVPAESNQGSAYVFVRSLSGWQQQAKLRASDGAKGDQFGASVAIDGDTAVISSRRAPFNSDTGAIYIFTRSGETWTQIQKIVPPEAQPGDIFGVSVGISGDTIVAGSQQGGEFGRGWVHVYDRIGAKWSFSQRIEPLDADRDNNFGNALDIEGNRLVVGAPNDETSGSSSGSAYVFARVNGLWEQESKLLPNAPIVAEHMGNNVSISGNTVFIDAFRSNTVGRALVFRYVAGNWSQDSVLTPPDGDLNDRFSQDLAVSGRTAVVASYTDDDLGENSGSVYLYEKTGNAWSNSAKINRIGGSAGDWFGFSVEINRSIAVIGVPGDDANGDGSGAVEIYELKSSQ